MSHGRRLEAHDLVFGAFLLLTAGRLVAVEGIAGPHAIVYAGFLALHALVLWAAPIWLRLAFYPFALQAAYFTLGTAMRTLAVPSADGLLQQLDLRLLGGNLSVALEPIAHPWLTDLMSA